MKRLRSGMFHLSVPGKERKEVGEENHLAIKHNKNGATGNSEAILTKHNAWLSLISIHVIKNNNTIPGVYNVIIIIIMSFP